MNHHHVRRSWITFLKWHHISANNVVHYIIRPPTLNSIQKSHWPQNVCATKGFFFFSLIAHSEHVRVFHISSIPSCTSFSLTDSLFLLILSPDLLTFPSHCCIIFRSKSLWKLVCLMQLNFKFSWAYSTSDTLWCLFLSTLTA